MRALFDGLSPNHIGYSDHVICFKATRISVKGRSAYRESVTLAPLDVVAGDNRYLADLKAILFRLLHPLHLPFQPAEHHARRKDQISARVPPARSAGATSSKVQ